VIASKFSLRIAQYLLPYNSVDDMESTGKNILLFAQENIEVEKVADILVSRNFKVVKVVSLTELLKVFDLTEFDLAIIGLAPQQESITDFSVSIRSICDVPVLFIFPAGTDPAYLAQVKGCGDDFLLLPVRDEEVVLRSELIISCHSRQKNQSEVEKFSIGRMSFDFKNQVLHTRRGIKNLTRIEAQLLHLLCLHRNRVLPRELALEAIWGENDYFKSRSMDVYVAKLRKLFVHERAVSISNIHNVGFRLNIKDTVDGRKRISET
jgi:two-component system, OmpR family, response regulator